MPRTPAVDIVMSGASSSSAALPSQVVAGAVGASHTPGALDDGEPLFDEATHEDSTDLVELDKHYPVRVILKAVQMSYLLHNPNDLPDIMKLSAALLLPAEEYIEWLQRFETNEIRYPSVATTYKARRNLDWMNMLYQRRVFSQMISAQDRIPWALRSLAVFAGVPLVGFPERPSD